MITINIASLSLKELQKAKEDYIAKYIGDFNKPTNYNLTLKLLNRTIQAKG